MNSRESMFRRMECAYGEIRLKHGRYGGGWLACGCAGEEWDFDEKWDDLSGGDMDYSEAVEFFNKRQTTVLIENAKTADDAFELCVSGLVALHEEDLKNKRWV